MIEDPGKINLTYIFNPGKHNLIENPDDHKALHNI